MLAASRRALLPTMLLLLVAAAAPVRLAAQSTPAATPTTEIPTVVDQAIYDVEGSALAVSPDGHWLAVVDNSGDHNQLCAYDVSDLTQSHACADLTAADIEALDLSSPRWSPDSTRLAFTQDILLRALDADLWVFTAESGDLKNLTDDGHRGGIDSMGEPSDQFAPVDTEPAWSPDGREIAFARSLRTDRTQATISLMRIPADGSAEPTVISTLPTTEPFSIDFGTAWAPSGGTIYFTRYTFNQDDPDSGVWQVALDGSDLHQLAGQSGTEAGAPTFVAISPRGDLALVLYRGVLRTVAEAPPLALLDLTTGALTPLETTLVSDRPWPSVAAFSPDGAWLLYPLPLPENEAPERGDQSLILRDLATSTESILLSPVRVSILAIGDQLTWTTSNQLFLPARCDVDGLLVTLSTSPDSAPPSALAIGTPAGDSDCGG